MKKVIFIRLGATKADKLSKVEKAGLTPFLNNSEVTVSNPLEVSMYR